MTLRSCRFRCSGFRGFTDSPATSVRLREVQYCDKGRTEKRGALTVDSDDVLSDEDARDDGDGGGERGEDGGIKERAI